MAQVDPASESAPDFAAAPASSRRHFNPSGWLDLQGWLEVLAGIVIALIALLSSYDHISLPAGALQLPQQWGVWFIAASVALVAVVAEGFCEAVAQLATGSRLRAANQAAEERNRAAAAREQAARRARIQDGCLAAQC